MIDPDKLGVENKSQLPGAESGGKGGGPSHIAEQLWPLVVPIESVNLDPSNARRHDEKNLDAIKASLSRFGQRSPLIVQREGMIVRAGNGRLLAARALGWKQVAAVVVNESSIDAVAFAIADNRTAELATWDEATLAQLLDTMPKDVLGATGFSEKDLGELLAGLAPDVVEDEVPEPPVEPISKPGDLWLLGDHRLLCGDSTKAESWEKLKIPEGVACFTSPPYNLGGSIKLSGNTTLAKSGNAYDQHDDSVTEYGAFIQSLADLAIKHCEAVVFNVQPVAGCKAQLLRWMGDNAERICDVMTWDKGHAPPQMADGVLANRYEWLVILSRQNPASRRVPLSSWRGTVSSVYVGPPQRNNEYAEKHGATFPVHLPTFIIADLCNRASGVLDCCIGTGTTLIAAEQLGRRCYGIEISPAYCDVVVQRWENLTSKKATLETR